MHHRYIFWVYQDSRSPAVGPKGNSKFEILLLQIFSLKPKKKQVKYFQPLQKTILGSFILGFTMRKCKAKAVQADFQVNSRTLPHIRAYSNIFRHNQAYSGIIQLIQAFLEPCVALTYLEPWYIWIRGIFRTRSIFRTVVHSEHWHIQNPGVFKTLAYSEPRQTATMHHFAKIVNGYNYFRNISFSGSLLYEKNLNFYNAGLIFTPELFI